ncbi:MAG: GTP-binding protein [Anaerolineae bacterium]
MKAKKILVTGTFNSGKTLFVQTASEIPIVTTERRISEAQLAKVKEETTVAMDYGQVHIDDTLLHLYGTPGQNRFDFMWSILARDADAFVLVVDSRDRGSWMEAVQILRTLRKQERVPFVVAANKQDGRRAMSPAEIARALDLPSSVPVVSCVARDEASVRNVLQEALNLIS